MSSSYSANQYDSAFRSQRLQNWCETKRFKERPAAQEGHTTFIANDRGHLLPGVMKRDSAWPDFKGTWDLPARIPTHRINPTGRSVEGLSRLKSWGFDPQRAGQSQPRSSGRNSDKLPDVGKQTSGDKQRHCAAPSSADAPASRSRPVTGGERPAGQSQDPRAAVAGSIAQSPEDKRATQATGKDGPLSRRSAAEGEPASRPAAGGGAGDGPEAGERSPASNVSEGAASRGAPPSSEQTHADAQRDQ